MGLEYHIVKSERKELCAHHVVSQWAIDNWDLIATECYISVKAENVARLLGMNISKGCEEFRACEGIAYKTGHEIQRLLRS